MISFLARDERRRDAIGRGRNVWTSNAVTLSRYAISTATNASPKLSSSSCQPSIWYRSPNKALNSVGNSEVKIANFISHQLCWRNSAPYKQNKQTFCFAMREGRSQIGADALSFVWTFTFSISKKKGPGRNERIYLETNLISESRPLTWLKTIAGARHFIAMLKSEHQSIPDEDVASWTENADNLRRHPQTAQLELALDSIGQVGGVRQRCCHSIATYSDCHTNHTVKSAGTNQITSNTASSSML